MSAAKKPLTVKPALDVAVQGNRGQTSDSARRQVPNGVGHGPASTLPSPYQKPASSSRAQLTFAQVHSTHPTQPAGHRPPPNNNTTTNTSGGGHASMYRPTPNTRPNPALSKREPNTMMRPPHPAPLHLVKTEPTPSQTNRPRPGPSSMATTNGPAGPASSSNASPSSWSHPPAGTSGPAPRGFNQPPPPPPRPSAPPQQQQQQQHSYRNTQQQYQQPQPQPPRPGQQPPHPSASPSHQQKMQANQPHQHQVQQLQQPQHSRQFQQQQPQQQQHARQVQHQQPPPQQHPHQGHHQPQQQHPNQGQRQVQQQQQQNLRQGQQQQSYPSHVPQKSVPPPSTPYHQQQQQQQQQQQSPRQSMPSHPAPHQFQQHPRPQPYQAQAHQQQPHKNTPNQNNAMTPSPQRSGQPPSNQQPRPPHPAQAPRPNGQFAQNGPQSMSGQQPSSLPSAGGPPTTGLSAAQQHQRPPGGPSALEQEIARLQKQLSDEQRARDEAAKELRTQLSNVSQQLAQQQEENFNLQLALTTTDTENNHMQKELEQVKKQLSFKEAEVKEADRLRARAEQERGTMKRKSPPVKEELSPESRRSKRRQLTDPRSTPPASEMEVEGTSDSAPRVLFEAQPKDRSGPVVPLKEGQAEQERVARMIFVLEEFSEDLCKLLGEDSTHATTKLYASLSSVLHGTSPATQLLESLALFLDGFGEPMPPPAILTSCLRLIQCLVQSATVGSTGLQRLITSSSRKRQGLSPSDQQGRDSSDDGGPLAAALGGSRGLGDRLVGSDVNAEMLTGILEERQGMEVASEQPTETLDCPPAINLVTVLVDLLMKAIDRKDWEGIDITLRTIQALVGVTPPACIATAWEALFEDCLLAEVVMGSLDDSTTRPELGLIALEVLRQLSTEGTVMATIKSSKASCKLLHDSIRRVLTWHANEEDRSDFVSHQLCLSAVRLLSALCIKPGTGAFFHEERWAVSLLPSMVALLYKECGEALAHKERKHDQKAFEPSTDEQINLVREAFLVITSIASTVDKPIHDLSILSLTTKPLEAINFRLMNGLLDRRLEDIQEDAFHLQTALLGDQAHVDPAK